MRFFLVFHSDSFGDMQSKPRIGAWRIDVEGQAAAPLDEALRLAIQLAVDGGD
jgi:hypothetical protein